MLVDAARCARRAAPTAAPLLLGLLLVGSHGSAATDQADDDASRGRATPHKVIAFAGSTRSASCNAGVIRYAMAAAARLTPRLDVEVIDVARWPLFDQDLIDEGRVPEDVLAAVRSVYAADAVLISTPEYNFGLAPVTTNAVAWLSRKDVIPGSKAEPLRFKPVALLSAGGDLGGARAQLQAHSSFAVFLDMPIMNWPQAKRTSAHPAPRRHALPAPRAPRPA